MEGREDLTDRVDVLSIHSPQSDHLLSIDLASAVAVSRMQPPNASQAGARAESDVQSTEVQGSEIHPCLRILPAAAYVRHLANRLNSCRCAAIHVCVLPALSRTISIAELS
jgi:hypothetical protein